MCIGLPVILAARIVQLYFMIEGATGIIKEEWSTYGSMVTWLVWLTALCVAVVSFVGAKEPLSRVEKNSWLCMAAAVLAICMIYDGAVQLITLGGVLGIIYASAAALGGVFFAIYALSLVLSVRVNPLLPILMVVWSIVRVIITFMGYASEVNIPDHVFNIILQIVTILFVFYLARYIAGVNRNTNGRKLIATAFAVIILTFAQTIPSAVILVCGGRSALHSESLPSAVTFGLLVFALTFVMVVCKNKSVNLIDKR